MSCNICTTRRRFLGGLGAGAAALFYSGLPTGVRQAFAEGPDPSGKLPELKDHYFVFVYFRGGWDTLMCLDPRDPGLFNEANKGTTLIEPGYYLLNTQAPNDEPYLETSIGAMSGFMGDLTQHLDKMAIIRGINMETVAHETGYRRFLTGKVPLGTAARGNSTDVYMASLLGEKNIIPNISMGQESYNEDLSAYANALRVGSASQLVATLTRDNALDSLYEKQIASLIKQTSDCAYHQNSNYSSSTMLVRDKVNQMLAADLQSQFELNANTPEMKALKQHYGYGPQGVPTGPAIAAQAFRAGVARCVSFHAAGNYDSHGYLDQGPKLMKNFNALARFVEDMESSEFPDGSGDSWLDHTTVLCFSEFARTPLVNERMGREHWISNSCLLLGGGFKGGQIIGATSDVGMMPMPIDLATGQVSENGVIIKPEHVLRTLYSMVGVTDDVADLRAKPITALLPE